MNTKAEKIQRLKEIRNSISPNKIPEGMNVPGDAESCTNQRMSLAIAGYALSKWFSVMDIYETCAIDSVVAKENVNKMHIECKRIHELFLAMSLVDSLYSDKTILHPENRQMLHPENLQWFRMNTAYLVVKYIGAVMRIIEAAPDVA